MRLRTIERGENLGHQLLFSFISLIAGARLPDAARLVMYHKDFYGRHIASWTDSVMRGPSHWSIGERELIAAMVARWNACPFCIDAHGSIAALELGDAFVHAALQNLHITDLPYRLAQTLTFLNKLTETPDQLSAQDVQSLMGYGLTEDDLEDAIAIAAVFSITVRCANTLGFTRLKDKDKVPIAKRMLTRGYAGRGSRLSGRPDHKKMAEQLGHSVFERSGETDPILRKAIAQRIAGGPPLPPVYDELVLLISKTSHRTTDEQVRLLVGTTGSENAAFEIIIAAAVAAGLRYWNTGCRILTQTGHSPQPRHTN